MKTPTDANPRRPLPLVFVATGLASTLSACGPAQSEQDAGPQVCQTGCYAGHAPDGGYYRTADGGVQCIC